MPRSPKAAPVAEPDVPPRPQRVCVICRQTDDHPRHDEILQLTPDLIVASFHLDCHALLDPPCESCAAQVAGSDGVTGAAMRAHIVGAPVNQTQGA